jgi:hypothetical protein
MSTNFVPGINVVLGVLSIIQWLLETCSHTIWAYNITRIGGIKNKISGKVKQHGNSLNAQKVLSHCHIIIQFYFRNYIK